MNEGYKYHSVLDQLIDDLQKDWGYIDFWQDIREKLEDAYLEGVADGRQFDGPH